MRAYTNLVVTVQEQVLTCQGQQRACSKPETHPGQLTCIWVSKYDMNNHCFKRQYIIIAIVQLQLIRVASNGTQTFVVMLQNFIKLYSINVQPLYVYFSVQTGSPMATVLEIFGEYFLQYCLRHGYDKMLRTLGSDFKSFIQNLDSLHALLAMTYKNIDAPSFR